MPGAHGLPVQGVGGGAAVNLNKISSVLYTAARVSRDINAISRGPGAIGRRVVRKASGRAVNGGMARLLRKLLGA